MTLRFIHEGDGGLGRIQRDTPSGTRTGGLVDYRTWLRLRQLDDDTKWWISENSVMDGTIMGSSGTWEILGGSRVTRSRFYGSFSIMGSTVTEVVAHGSHGKKAVIVDSTVSQSDVTASDISSATVISSCLTRCEVRNSTVKYVTAYNARIIDMNVTDSRELLVVYVPMINGFLTCGPALDRKGYRFVVGCSVFDTWDELLAAAVEEGASVEGELERLKALKPLIELMERRLQEGGK